MSVKDIVLLDPNTCKLTLNSISCKNTVEKLKTAFQLRTLTEEADFALAILKKTTSVSTEPIEIVADITKDAKPDSLLKKIADCFSNILAHNKNDPNIKVVFDGLIANISMSLIQFKTSIATAYTTLTLSELANWGSCFQGKSSTLIDDSISQAQEEVLKTLKQYSPVKHEGDKFDFVTEDLDLASLSPITTGMDSRSRPFIIIKAKALVESTSLNGELAVSFRGKYRDDYGNLCKTPYWRVVRGKDYFGHTMTHENFIAKLQQFFTEGLTWEYNELKFRLTFPKPS